MASSANYPTHHQHHHHQPPPLPPPPPRRKLSDGGGEISIGERLAAARGICALSSRKYSRALPSVFSAPRMGFRFRYIFCGVLVICLLLWYFSLSGRDDFTGYYSPADVDENSPFIFIGGIPRSGTTLMRAMLDAHPIVRCGEETRVIPRILSLRSQWKKSEKEWKRLQEAGVTDPVINAAISAFIVKVIAGHGAPAERLCNKDPFTLKSTTYLSQLFPHSKYILMLRDGRATVHSIISRRVTITGFDLDDFRQCLTKWNAGITIMYDQCVSAGVDRCLMVHYEQLVLHPEAEMRRILRFLDIEWHAAVLSHEEHIGKDISLSKTERSSDQVIKPVNLDALTKWVGQIPADVVADMASVAPMLEVLGYDPRANPPNYGTPDEAVLRKTKDIHERGDVWYKKAVEVVNDPGRVDLPFGAQPQAAAAVAVDGEVGSEKAAAAGA